MACTIVCAYTWRTGGFDFLWVLEHRSHRRGSGFLLEYLDYITKGVVSAVLALIFVAIFIYCVYYTFFAKIEVIFYQFGLTAGKRSFYYADINDIEYVNTRTMSCLIITGATVSYKCSLDPISGLNKKEKAIIKSISNFLKSS